MGYKAGVRIFKDGVNGGVRRCEGVINGSTWIFKVGTRAVYGFVKEV